MSRRSYRSFRGLCLAGSLLFLPFLVYAHRAGSGEPIGGPPGAEQSPDSSSKLEVTVQDESGGLVISFALVTLSTSEGKMLHQVKAKEGHVEFDGLAAGRYTLQVTADGYDRAKQSVTVAGPQSEAIVQVRQNTGEFMNQTSVEGINSSVGDVQMQTAVAEQRTILKIAQALRDNKPQKARLDLAKMYLDFSTNSTLNYLYGVYEKEMKDIPKAKYYWRLAVGGDSKNLAALMQLGQTALDEGKPEEALPYLKRAAQVSPTIWHPHALMVAAYAKQKQYDRAIEEAERAIELGHGQAAAAVQPVLASALAAEGNKEQAVKILRDYLKDHPDPDAQNLLAALERPDTPASGTVADSTASGLDFAPILPSAWMPPQVDDKVPPVEAGIPCSLDSVLSGASMRVTELVKNVDRFDATESLVHERIGRSGLPSRPEMRSYHYMVSIGEVRPGILSVEEFRDDKKVQDDPPDGIVTVGLPAMALVFHPAQMGNYNFTCEGLARSSSGFSWQVHFQQRADRIPTLHGYRLGDNPYAVGLKGRAWISADSFQIVRLETDLVKPYPDIRLVAEHTLIDYGPVRFRTKDVGMWLPKKAEVYFDWRGKRVHRRLTFTDYSLFSVETNQKIQRPKNAPKDDAPTPPVSGAPSSDAKQQRNPQP